ncbi:MAG: FKBP-type peptidyl-prolyl cis-trans isomerase [Verrucomicrobiota bacterium]|jgi:FKBP-type peptidyl-prolyl cis-trans isomerase FklB
MKTTIWTVIICLGAAARLFADDTNLLNNEKARVSYAIGMSVGHSLQDVQNQGIEVNTDLVGRGIKDMLSGGTTLLTSNQMQATVMAFQKDLAARRQQKREEFAAKMKAEGEAFLATNKNNPGVVALPDGLQYKVITNGTGALPAPTDTVTVNYRGTLLDGTEFDSSFKHSQPSQFIVGGVIPGWTEALLKMKVGSRWQLFVPAELAYGDQGRPGVPPNSVLIFDVDLLSTKSPPPPAPPAAAAPLTSDIIKVPSAEEMKKGAKIEVIKPEDLKKMQQQ